MTKISFLNLRQFQIFIPIFLESQPLSLGKYVMTRAKTKEIIATIRPKLAVMIHKYELSGNGAGQRDEEHEEYCQVDLIQCVDCDDRANVISSYNESYLLYW